MSTKPCDNYREQIEQYCGGELDSSQSQMLLTHLRQCAGCSAYLAALEEQDRQLTQWVEVLKPQIQAGQAQTLAQLRQMQSLSQQPVKQPTRFAWARYAAAACILLAAGFLVGHGLRPAVDVEKLQQQWAAAVVPQMERQVTESVLQSLRKDVAGQCVALQENLSDQISSQLEAYAEQTVVRNDLQTYRLLTELIDAIATAQSQNQQWVMSAMTKLEKCRLEDQEKMRTQFANFATYTGNELSRTQQQLKALSTSTKLPN